MFKHVSHCELCYQAQAMQPALISLVELACAWLVSDTASSHSCHSSIDSYAAVAAAPLLTEGKSRAHPRPVLYEF